MTNVFRLLSAQPWVEHLGWTLVHFLWQGALIAAAYGVARRAGTPQLRYLLACATLAAMVAAPFVTYIVMAPDSVQSNPYIGTIPASSAVANLASLPPATLSLAAHAWHDDVMPWLVLAWFIGAAVFWVRLTGGWIVVTRMRSILTRPAPPEWQHKLNEIAARIRVVRQVRLIVSTVVQVPTVVGWLRPVILMPLGALAGLPPEHVEALLAHELAHIRRHDYLANILQSIAEVLLFYHPAVWWISSQLRNERELCCDDEAVAISNDALTYVRALVGLESCRPSHFSPALAASGGSLPQRIGRLLGQGTRARRLSSGPGAIAAAILLAFASCGIFGQPTAKLSFEVASIKPNNLGGGHLHMHNLPGRLVASMTTRELIKQAYDLKDFQVSGGPSWLSADNYDFVATTATPIDLTTKALEPYLQSLLADRFRFKYHRETKDFSVYFLLTAKGGPKLTKHTGTAGKSVHSDGEKDKVSMNATNLTMAGLAAYLARNMDRPVIDNTRLDGEFDLKLDWSPQQISESSGPSIFTALREQLGLRLESGKGPVEMVVVDSIEKPSEN